MIIADRYEVLDFLGEGGMGVVYRGVDTQTQTDVAIKMLKPDVMAKFPEQAERFRREAIALIQLDHPNIVRVWDAVEANGQLCIVMQFMSGGTLRDLMKREKRLSIKYTVDLALDLADALTRTHRLRIIHRDVKPENVLLSESGVPHLTDFGQAHIADAETLTRAGQIMGTVNYMAPEVLYGNPADPRTDIWGFGVMLYEMVSGFRPFMGEDQVGLIKAILGQPVPNLGKLRPDCPPRLVQLIHAMLEKNPDDRIFSVREIGLYLESVLTDLESATDTDSP